MDQKRLLQLVAVLAVLVVIAWAAGFLGGSASTIETPSVEIAVSDIDAITIRKGGDEVVAERREDGSWILLAPVAAAADTTTARNLLNELSGFQIESLVSSQPDRYARFQVDSLQATYLRLGAEAPVELFVGKTGPDFQSRYVRLGGDERVFLARGVPSPSLELDRWREKELWSYPNASVQRVAVTGPDGSYLLSLGGASNGWRLTVDGEETDADSAEVARYLGRISTLKADGFLMDVDAASVADSVSHTVEISVTDGTTRRIDIHQRQSDAAALVDGAGDVVKLLSYRVKTLVPSSGDLLPDDRD